MSGVDDLGERFLPSGTEPVVHGEGKQPKKQLEKELAEPESEPEPTE